MGAAAAREGLAAERAVVLFAELLERRAQGERCELDELIELHPELSGELEKVAGHWRAVGPVLDSIGFDLTFPELVDRTLGAGVDPRVTLVPEAEQEPGGTVRARTNHATRYRVRDEIARGGMGAILRVWDENLKRPLAMKVMRARSQRPDRFLEEAEVTAQLDHPGVVPVHALGLDSKDRPYFTMKLVGGRTLSEVFTLVAEGKEGWSLPRALGVLLKVCEAVAHAHSLGVVHRDLKPANVMVGSFGEVYVMDWGLARVLGEPDRKDVRLREPAGDGPGGEPPDALLTMDGDVVGTPAYMPPEQALGEVSAIGPAADVYSIGAMLYELASGRMPYASEAAPDPRAILERVRRGPPRPLHELAPDVPPELAAICERAMARRPGDRYATTEALAADLQAFLEGRVVRAHRTGALAELRKWVRRNRSFAWAVCACLLVIVTGLVVALLLRADADRQRDGVLRLAAFQDLDELRERAEGLWPPWPEQLDAIDLYLRDAEEFVAGLEPRPGDPGHSARLAALEARAPDLSREERWLRSQLATLVSDIEAFADPESGLIDGVSAGFGWGVARRRDWAREIDERTVSGAGARALWAEVSAAIAEHEAYGGLELAPQRGLLPIGPDPRTGLWEFVHLATGGAPRRGAGGQLEVTQDCGLVFVLLPAGTFWMAAQNEDPSGQNYDPWAEAWEVGVHEVELSAFFLSKYEMTQAQWLQLNGSNPSRWNPSDFEVTLLHPVDQMTWTEAWTVLGRYELSLPSEAQWEYGARGGTDTVWWTGDDSASLIGAVNLIEEHWPGFANSDFPTGVDGYPITAPVDALAPNGYGLYHVLGNQHEFVLDSFVVDFFSRSPRKDPVCDPSASQTRIIRGGTYNTPPLLSRSAFRWMGGTPDNLGWGGPGLRPARRVLP